jgi:hypothetical protein
MTAIVFGMPIVCRALTAGARTQNLPSNYNRPPAKVSDFSSGNAVLPSRAIRSICRSYVVAGISCLPHPHRTSGIILPRDGVRLVHLRSAGPSIRARDVAGLSAQASKLRRHKIAVSRRDAIRRKRCRGIAIERDDLSLLTAITCKERAKCAAKGIATVTQLSYGYRPRRRKRNRTDAERSTKSTKRAAPVVKNDHRLKALAVKKNQIHIVGAPSAKFTGVPIFLDVEGMPDRDFYYLVGLRYGCGSEQVERSFWAEGLDGEREIWENFLREIKPIENAQIISYGAYESRFLRQMKARYVAAPDDVEFVDHLIETLVNLVGCIYGKVYFPTFSNSLKEVGRYLGFEWSWPLASGAAALLLRRAWELRADDRLKHELIGYNMDDCRAAARVADALVRICCGGASGLDAVDVASLQVGFQRTFGTLDCALPEFKKINDAAYWDYQRSKVYARTNKIIRRTVTKSQRRSKRATVEQEVRTKCRATRFWTHRRGSHVVYDLKFMRRGIKRWAVRYRYGMHQLTALTIRAEPAGIYYLSADRITSLNPECGRACIITVRYATRTYQYPRN